MKKLTTALLFMLLFAGTAFSEGSLKASLTKGNYQIQTQGKWNLKPNKTANLGFGDFIILGPTSEVQIDLGAGATMILGGSSVILISPWNGVESGSINLIYGQAKITTGTAEVNINSPLGEVNLEEETIGYISVTGETLGFILEKGEGELSAINGDDESIELGEIAFYAGELESKQATTAEILGPNFTLDSPDWFESPLSLWPIDKLAKLKLVDSKRLPELKQVRVSSNLNLTEMSIYTPIKIDQIDSVAGKRMDDAPLLPLANLEDLKSRRIDNVMEIQITFEK